MKCGSIVVQDLLSVLHHGLLLVVQYIQSVDILLYIRSVQVFQKSRSYLKIQGVTKVTLGRFLQVLGTIIQSLVANVSWCLRFVPLCCTSATLRVFESLCTVYPLTLIKIQPTKAQIIF